MKFIIDRPIKNSYSEGITYEQTNDYLWCKDEEKRHFMELDWIEPNEEVISGYIDDNNVCHRVVRETIEFIEVNTIEELYAITKENDGKIVFGTNVRHEGADGWIEIYDDYRE
jgi:xanthine dehydrogenase iron-sulfur cluster and FAD-binding subunit A